MLTNALCKSFQRLRVTAKGTVLTRYISTNASQAVRSTAATFLCNPTSHSSKSIYEPQLILSSLRPGSLDLDLPFHPTIIKDIGELDRKLRINEPPVIRQRQEDVVPERTVDLPTNQNIVEKRAERMIVIRRRKMRRHKLKKLRKRMKFYWAKLTQRREMAKEKAFHAELLGKIRKAEEFDAKAYVASRLAILDNVRIPSKYKGVVLPEWQIKEFLKQDEEKRYQRRNKPRLPRD